MKGQGGGGTAKGGGKNRGSGQDVVIKKTKAMKTTAINENILKLRAALFNESGQDKNILEGISSSFLNYDRNDLSVVIEFVPKLKKEDFEYCFETIVENMEEIYDASGYGWDDDDKERELTEQGARFLILRDKGSEDQRIIGFIHFRFTVQGEVIDQMMGETCLYVLDMHLEKEIQKKGLGKHLLVILELIARKQSMSRLSFPIFLGDEATKTWLLKQGKGYSLDISYSAFGFEPEAEVSVACVAELFSLLFLSGFRSVFQDFHCSSSCFVINRSIKLIPKS
jgi:GNAT superfamily N-acetyltransferase